MIFLLKNILTHIIFQKTALCKNNLFIGVLADGI